MAYIELSASAFYHNLGIIAQYCGSVDKVALVLKDNAYGHGLLPMARLASEFGIRRAVVRTVDEAEQINAFFDYILVLAERPERASGTFHFTVNALETLAHFPHGCKVELKVDSGMHRNGISPDELEAAFATIAQRGLKLMGVFTHHRSADELSSEWFWQNRNFESVKVRTRKLCERFGMNIPAFHSANSAALFRRNSTFDEAMARVGIAAYGCLQMAPTLAFPPLRPVLSLWAEKIATRRIAQSQRIGYGGIYRAEEEESVTTYDAGYADGLLRSASNGYVAPQGERLLGRISMDNCCFSGGVEKLRIFNDANRYAAAAGTIGYELLVGLHPALARHVVA